MREVGVQFPDLPTLEKCAKGIHPCNLLRSTHPNDLTFASKRPMYTMSRTGAQNSAPGPMLHSGNIVNNASQGRGALPEIDCHRSRV